jgi:phage head maturation protease
MTDMRFRVVTSWDAPHYPSPPPNRSVEHAMTAIDAALAAGTGSECVNEVIGRIDAALSRRVEWRSAATETVGVDQAARIITVIAVPWASPASVPLRGQAWQETFVQGAFDGIDLAGSQIRVNRGYDRSRTIGKVVRFDPHDQRGPIAEMRIARTTLGDESLILANEGCLSASIGFTIPSGGEQLDHRTRSRRITRAVLDHISLVEDPAYIGASVLSAVG